MIESIRVLMVAGLKDSERAARVFAGENGAKLLTVRHIVET